MLQRIRDRVSGWIAGVIIALVGGAFILFGVEYYFEQGSGGQDDAATVNGVTISESQVSTTFSQLQRQTLAETKGQPLSSELTAQLKSYALQSLISQTALSTTLHDENFVISTQQLKSIIAETPEFQENGQFSEAKFMQLLYQINLSPDQFFEQYQSRFVIHQVMSGVGAAAFALPSEVNQSYSLANQKRALGYFVVPAAQFISQMTVTPDQIKKYYQNNPTQFETPAKVSVAYLVLSPTDIEKTVVVSPAEAEQYYQAHLSNYEVPAQWEVAQITVPVAANASKAVADAALQKAQSAAPLFKQNKDTGFVSSTVTLSAAQISQPLQTTVTKLSVGGVSAPFRTPNGYTILKLLKTIPAETHAFHSVQSNIIQLLQHQRVNEKLSKMSSQLADLTYTNPDSLTIAAKALQLPVQTTEMMSKAGEKTGIFSNPAVLSAVFSNAVFESDNNSNPITLADGSQVVLRILKKETSQPVPLASVQDHIKKLIAAKQASSQAGLLAYELQNKLSTGEDPKALAKQYHLQWQTAPLTQMDAKSTVPADILSAAFSIPVTEQKQKQQESNKPMGVQAISYQQDNYAVIAVLQVQNGDVSHADANAKNQLSLQLTGAWGQLLQHSFVDSVLNSAKIKVINQ